MAIGKTFTVSVIPEQDAFVHGQVRCGRFSSVSEVVRAGLRLLEREKMGPHLDSIGIKTDNPNADA